MIKEDYVSFEVAKLLKENGFDEPVMYHFTPDGTQRKFQQAFYKDDVAQPTLQMAMKWLRKNYRINVVIYTEISAIQEVVHYHYCIESLIPPIIGKRNEIYSDEFWYTYEESCDSAIKYCLTNLI